MNMTRKKLTILGCLFLTLTFTFTLAKPKDGWLHIRISEDQGKGEQVNVNVPLNMIRALLPMVEELDVDDMMGLDLGNGEFEGLDLHAVLEALHDTPDSDFVTVRSDDESVRVYKENGYIKVLVEERDDSEKVRVTVPLDVLDALVSGPDDTLNLSAAIERLMTHSGGDLVTVDSDNESVRIWIDFDPGSSN